MLALTIALSMMSAVSMYLVFSRFLLMSPAPPPKSVPLERKSGVKSGLALAGLALAGLAPADSREAVRLERKPRLCGRSYDQSGPLAQPPWISLVAVLKITCGWTCNHTSHSHLASVKLFISPSAVYHHIWSFFCRAKLFSLYHWHWYLVRLKKISLIFYFVFC